jgi:hypothetical protein
MPHADHESPTHGMDTGATPPVPMPPQPQEAAMPYIFYQHLPYEEPKKRVIHGLEDVLPQPEDSSARLEEKVRLLRALAAHVDAESARVHAREQQQVLTRLVAALDDEPTFTRLLEAEGSVLGEIHDESVTAVVPPPQTGVVTGVETARWHTTIETLQRLQARCKSGRASLRRVVKTYQDRFAALCFLESQEELPVDINAMDVKQILQRQTHVHLKAQPKKTAEELLTILEHARRGVTLAEILDLAQNTKRHVTTLLRRLEAQGHVYKNKSSWPRKLTFYYAVSPVLLRGETLSEDVASAIKERLLHQGHARLTLTPAQAWQVLAHDGRGYFTRRAIERLLTHDSTTILLAEDLRQILHALEQGGQLVALALLYLETKDTYYLNTPTGYDALCRDIGTAGDPFAKSRLQAGLQRLDQMRQRDAAGQTEPVGFRLIRGGRDETTHDDNTAR